MMETKEMITDEFMDWEERDSSKISLFSHCICGKYDLILESISMNGHNPYSKHVFSFYCVGSIAGMVEHLALYPVDTLKVGCGSSSIRGTKDRIEFTYLLLMY